MCVRGWGGNSESKYVLRYVGSSEGRLEVVRKKAQGIQEGFQEYKDRIRDFETEKGKQSVFV